MELLCKKADKKATLTKAMDVKIKRHVKIKGLANPYDPECEIYFEYRLNKQAAENLKVGGGCSLTWKKQNGKCPVCQQRIDDETKWDKHHITWKVHEGKNTLDNQSCGMAILRLPDYGGLIY